MANQYVHNYDAGHGWVSVPMDVINQLGIQNEISRYSYRMGQVAYLEEDCDAGKFINAYKAKFGREPVITSKDCGMNSVIRSHSRYYPD